MFRLRNAKSSSLAIYFIQVINCICILAVPDGVISINLSNSLIENSKLQKAVLETLLVGEGEILWNIFVFLRRRLARRYTILGS